MATRENMVETKRGVSEVAVSKVVGFSSWQPDIIVSRGPSLYPKMMLLVNRYSCSDIHVSCELCILLALCRVRENASFAALVMICHYMIPSVVKSHVQYSQLPPPLLHCVP